jgi:hypothetical protein
MNNGKVVLSEECRIPSVLPEIKPPYRRFLFKLAERMGLRLSNVIHNWGRLHFKRNRTLCVLLF